MVGAKVGFEAIRHGLLPVGRGNWLWGVYSSAGVLVFAFNAGSWRVPSEYTERQTFLISRRMPRQVFLMGNKRSGTSLLVRLLNLHPEVFASHESDILWILFQARKEWPEKFECHPWDGPLGMN